MLRDEENSLENQLTPVTGGRRQHPRSPNLARMRAARLRGGKAPTYADQLIEELRHVR